MTPWRARAWAAGAVVVAAACGARSELLEPPPPPEPLFDAGDLPATACSDAGVPHVFVVTEDQRLFAYDPPGSFHTIGKVSCGIHTAFSMAVDRAGHAYVELSNSQIWVVDTDDANCSQAPFSSKKFNQFGMGFSANVVDPGETLFVATDGLLGVVDLATFDVTKVGKFSKVGSLELSGTGDGRLFGFGVVKGSPKVHLVEIDKTDATIVSDAPLQLGNHPDAPSAWAFAAFGGQFYFFTSHGGPSTVHRYDPATGSVAHVADVDGVVVGAGVSTCAPAE